MTLLLLTLTWFLRTVFAMFLMSLAFVLVIGGGCWVRDWFALRAHNREVQARQRAQLRRAAMTRHPSGRQR